MAASNWLLRYSAAVCRRPRVVIASCVVATLVCSMGLFRVNIITNPDLIWVPPNSLANRQKAFFDDAFDPFFRVNQVFFVAEEPSADMVATRYLQRVMGVQRAIETANFTSGGELRGFDSLCFKPIDGEGCLVESPSQYWVGDPIVLAGDPSPSLTAACQTSDAFLASRSPCMDEIGTPVMRGVVFGDIGVNPDVASPDPCGGSVPKAGALVLTFLLNNFRDPEYQKMAERWEKEVFLAVVEESRALLENDVQAPMKVSYMAQRSVADSLSVEAGENAWVLIVSYLCMFLYVSLILGSPCHVIRSRYSLALTGITIVVASLMTTIGLLSMAGVGTTLIVWEVVPFLTLAIGVDNMVILSREFDRLETTPEFEAATSSSHNNKGGDISEGASATGPTFSWASTSSVLDRGREDKEAAELRLEDRMGAAVSKVAPSILGAAVCEAVAFSVGALTDIPALRQFCLVAATAVLVGFILQISWFIAALSLDARRVAQGRLDLAPWLIEAEDRDGYDWYSTRNDPMRALRAPLLGHGDRSSGRPGQRLQMFLRQFGSELVSPPRPRRRTSSSSNNNNNNNNATIAPGDMDWSSPRSSKGRGDRGGGRSSGGRRSSGGGGRSGLLRVDTQLSDEDDEFVDALGNSIRDQRDLTAEFGSGSEANPALLASSASGPTRRSVSAPAGDGGTAAEEMFSTQRSGGGGGGDDGGRGVRALGRSGGSGRRKWVEENPSSDGESAIEELARTRTGVHVEGEAKELNMSSFSSPSSRQGNSISVSNPSFLGEGSVSVSVGLPSEDGSRLNASVAGGDGGGRDRHSGDVQGRGNDFRHTSSSGRGRGGHGTVGGHVVDGYVSLGSHHHQHQHQQLRQHRRGSEDDRDRDGAGVGVRGAGAGQALSMFRKQLYEEGRGKGGKGGNLASRLLERHYLPALFSQGGTMCTLVGAAVLAILGLIGLANLQMGLEPQLAAPTDFYLQDYYDAQFSKGEAGPPAYVVFSDVDYFEAYHDEDVREAFRGVSTGLAQLQRYVQAPIYSWFDTMVGWVHQKDTLVSDCPAQTEITDETSFYAMVEVFLSIPIESQCCQSYGVCGAQFESDVTFDAGDEDGIRRIKASRLRFNMQPLTTQRDYVNSYYYVKVATDMLADKLPERYEGQRKAKANKAVGNLAFPYSLYFVFYEQYAFIQGVALQNIFLALAVVFLSIALLAGFALAAFVSSLVLGTTLGTVGLVWIWGVFSSAPYAVSINAVSVCNLVMSLGLSVEFCLHVAMAFQNVRGTRQERAEAAMKSAGASVLTGITLTKLVGVSVLAIAPSLLFRVYYFRMYMATVAVGAFQGLAVLPVLLSMWGPNPPPSNLHLPGCSSWGGGDSWCEDDETTDELSRSRKGGYCDLGGGGTPPSRNPLAVGWNRGRGGGGALWDAWGDKEDLPVEGPLDASASHTSRPPSLSAGARAGVRVRESYVSLGSGTPRSAVFPSDGDGGGDRGRDRDPGVGVTAAREREENAQDRGAQGQDPPFSDPGAEAVAAGGLGAQDQDRDRQRQRRSNSTANSNRGSLGRRSSSGYSSRAKPLTQYSPW